MVATPWLALRQTAVRVCSKKEICPWRQVLSLLVSDDVNEIGCTCTCTILQAAPSDRAAAARLGHLESELLKLKDEQQQFTDQWRVEKDEMSRVQDIKEEIERVNLEVQQAERDYDLNR